MSYLEELPALMDEEHISSVLAGIADDNMRTLMNRMIYSKGTAWSYEKEWRICSGDGRNKTAHFEDIPFGENELDGVILGLNMNNENRKRIIEIANSYPNVELMEAIRSSSGFHHDIVSVVG